MTMKEETPFEAPCNSADIMPILRHGEELFGRVKRLYKPREREGLGYFKVRFQLLRLPPFILEQFGNLLPKPDEIGNHTVDLTVTYSKGGSFDPNFEVSTVRLDVTSTDTIISSGTPIEAGVNTDPKMFCFFNVGNNHPDKPTLPNAKMGTLEAVQRLYDWAKGLPIETEGKKVPLYS
jgi:hypothetical protein